MPRYYFSVIGQNEGVVDNFGTEFRDDAAAMDHALQLARQLIDSGSLDPADRHGWTIDIADGAGNVVNTLPLSAARDH